MQYIIVITKFVSKCAVYQNITIANVLGCSFLSISSNIVVTHRCYFHCNRLGVAFIGHIL